MKKHNNYSKSRLLWGLLTVLLFLIAGEAAPQAENSSSRPVQLKDVDVALLVDKINHDKSALLDRAVINALQFSDVRTIQAVALSFQDEDSLNSMLSIFLKIDPEAVEITELGVMAFTASDLMLRGISPTPQMLETLNTFERKFLNTEISDSIQECFGAVRVLYGHESEQGWSLLRPRLGWKEGVTLDMARSELADLINRHRPRQKIPGLLLKNIKDELQNKYSKAPSLPSKRPAVVLPPSK